MMEGCFHWRVSWQKWLSLVALLACPGFAAQGEGRNVTVLNDIVILEIDPNDVVPANLFDLEGKTLCFTPDESATTYEVAVLPIQWDSDLGDFVNQPREEVRFDHFTFPFSGRVWNSLFVHPQGCITFGSWQPCPDINGRFLSLRDHVNTFARDGAQGVLYDAYGGAYADCTPMIAPLYRRLTDAHSDGDVLLKEGPDHVVITWCASEPCGTYAFIVDAVPNWFQVTLYENGVIDFSYRTVSIRDAIVGVFPGVQSDASTVVTAVDYTSNLEQHAGNIVYEVFAYPGIPRVPYYTVIDELGDQFDFMAFFTDFRYDINEAGADSHVVRRDIEGIGCSPGPSCFRLQTVQAAAYIGAPWFDKKGTVAGWTEIQFQNYEPAVWLLSHELGHHWLAYADALIDGKVVSLSGGGVHWSECLQAAAAFPRSDIMEASPMGGAAWRDNGDGTYLEPTVCGLAPGYSHLDLYLMGLLPPAEVPPFFYLEGMEIIGTEEGADGTTTAIVAKGKRVDITIDDIIAANGPRIPRYEESQKAFNLGIVAMVLPGRQPSDLMLQRLRGMREAFCEYWSRATGGASTMDSVIIRLECPADIMVETPSLSGAEVYFVVPEAESNLGNVTVTCSHNPGDLFPQGVTMVTVIATDDATGWTRECEFTVTVYEPPVYESSVRMGLCGAFGPATFALMLVGLSSLKLSIRDSGRRSWRDRGSRG